MFRVRGYSGPVEKFTNWEWFQSLASDLISLESKLGQVRSVWGCVWIYLAPVCRLATSKITLLVIHVDLPSLDHLLKQILRLRKMWPVMQDPAGKPAVNWVCKTIRTWLKGRQWLLMFGRPVYTWWPVWQRQRQCYKGRGFSPSLAQSCR